MLKQTEVTRYEDSVERKESLKHREHIEHRTRQTEREKQRIQRERVKKGLMCFCILMVCVGTVVMAMDSLRISKRANAEAPMNQTAEVRVDVKEERVRQTAEVKRPKERIPIEQLPKIEVLYGIHVQDKGWSHYFADNSYGMAPAGRYITAVRAFLHNLPENLSGNLEYQVNLSGSGWLDWQSDSNEAGDASGTTPVEAVRMRLTGDLAEYYDILYSALQNDAWTDWAKNGEEVGQGGVGLWVDGIRVSVVRKDQEGVSYAGEIDPSKPMVALTYDDGPSKNATPRILAKLQEYGGKATFFMVGNRAMSYKDTIRQMVAQGCEVANHTYDHTLMNKVDPVELERQLELANQAVADVGGVTPVLMRPCGGVTNDVGMGVAGAISMPAVLWSIDTLDWKTRDAAATVTAVLDHVKDGDIILMHDLYDTTADASDILIPELINRGYQLVTVSELASYRGGMMPGQSYYKFRP